MIRRRPSPATPAPPPPRPTSATDPLAPTAQEWREEARERDARRGGRVARLAALLTLPLLAGGLYAFPLVYAWRWLCGRWPRLRPAGIVLALPAIAAVRQWPSVVFGPTLQLVALPRAAADAPTVWTLTVPWWPALQLVRPLTLPPAVSLHFAPLALPLGDPIVLLAEVLLEAWPTGLVLAAVLGCAWGIGGFWEGPRLRSRTVRDVLRRADKLRQKGGDTAIVSGLVLRGYIGMLYAPEGGGKTEWLLAMIAACARAALFCGLATRRAKWYLLTEQTDTTLAPYLRRWGLDEGDAARSVRIVTQEDAERLWRAHGYETRPDWEHFGPIALDDAGRWGADVFVIDTWTFWVGSGAGATMIDEAMAPLKAAMRERGFAQLILAHTNKDGDLLGNKEFRRLCDLAVKMLVPRGKDDPMRVFVYDKDRSNTKPGPHFGCVRDLTTDPPSYRVVPVLPEDLEPQKPGAMGGRTAKRTPTSPLPQAPPDGHQGAPTPTHGAPAPIIDLASVRSRGTAASRGVGGSSQGETRANERTNDDVSLLEALHRGGTEGLSTAELTQQTGLHRNLVHRRIEKLVGAKTVEKAGKRGKADVWRVIVADRETQTGVEQEDLA